MAIFDSTTGNFRNTQFVTNDLFLILMTKSYNQIEKKFNFSRFIVNCTKSQTVTSTSKTWTNKGKY